jgi:galactokinase
MTDFQTLFGHPPAASAHAPGRVNLIGEHTDYNGGYVLPSAIPQRTRVELAVRPDRSVQVYSDAPETGGEVVGYELGRETPQRAWHDYVQGVTSLLGSEGLSLPGLDIAVRSTVPVGSGLSSSAALTVSLLRGLRALLHLPLDDVLIARLGQRVENEFVGAQVGIMDPMAASLADERTALFLDARSLDYERVPLPAGAELVVIHSGVAHDHAAGDYNARRRECEQAAALLGVKQLRDIPAAEAGRADALPEPLDCRARHVITENQRVLEAVAAMRGGDVERLGALFNASHDSQRDDYAVSVLAIDRLVDLARSDEAVLGARLTGGGFGGSIVVLARAGCGRAVADHVASEFKARWGGSPRVLVPAG